MFVFFPSRRRHTRCSRDWSSDVCSSDLEAAALLEVGELGDLQAVEQNLPADAPCAEGRGFPVVLFKTNVVLLEVDADGAEALEVDVLHIDWRGLQDHLKLGMLVKTIGVLAVAAAAGPTTGRNIAHAKGVRADHVQESSRG